MDLAKRAEWMGLHALAQQTARILLSFEKSDDEFSNEWKTLRGFAEMGMEDRVTENGRVLHFPPEDLTDHSKNPQTIAFFS